MIRNSMIFVLGLNNLNKIATMHDLQRETITKSGLMLRSSKTLLKILIRLNEIR